LGGDHRKNVFWAVFSSQPAFLRLLMTETKDSDLPEGIREEVGTGVPTGTVVKDSMGHEISLDTLLHEIQLQHDSRMRQILEPVLHRLDMQEQMVSRHMDAEEAGTWRGTAEAEDGARDLGIWIRIPKFDGSTDSQLWARCVTHALADVDAGRAVPMLMRRIKGRALELLLSSDPVNWKAVSSIIRFMCTSFPSAPRESKVMEFNMLTMAKNEKPTSFLRRVVQLGRECAIPDGEIFALLRRTLPVDMIMHMIIAKVEDLNQLTTFVLQMDAVNKEKGARAVSTLTTSQEEKEKPTLPQKPQQNLPLRTYGGCAYCGQSGHGWRRCPQISCTNCGYKGHARINCPDPILVGNVNKDSNINGAAVVGQQSPS
jgi:hypothetical protein